MSEKKSWDIQPNRRPQQQPPARPADAPTRNSHTQSAPRQTRPAPKASPKPKSRPKPIKISTKPRVRAKQPEPVKVASAPQALRRKEKIPQGKEREPLKDRRKRARKRMRRAIGIFFGLLIIGLFLVTWLPAFRIQYVEAQGTDADSIQPVALQALKGTTAYIFPKDSIFFFPQQTLRDAILAKFPEVSAVSISRVSFDSIGISSIPRETAFIWCGSTYGQTNSGNAVSIQATSTLAATASSTPIVTTPAPTEPNCYEADSQGYVYATASADESDASSSDLLHVYGALTNTNTASPLGLRISGAMSLPNELEFVKAIKTLGVPIVTLVLRGDEADLYAQSGTRITYVIGQEYAAAQLAQSAFPSLNLNDGSLEYVDLRFPGKVYYKAYNADAQETGSGTGSGASTSSQ